MSPSERLQPPTQKSFGGVGVFATEFIRIVVEDDTALPIQSFSPVRFGNLRAGMLDG